MHQSNLTYFQNKTTTECRQSIFAHVSFQCLIVLNCCLKMTSLFGCVSGVFEPMTCRSFIYYDKS